MNTGNGRLIVSCAALALILLLPACQSNGNTKTPEPTQDAGADVSPDDINWLFVMTARTGSFDGKNLVLIDVPPTLMFSDRPYRVWGHMDTAHLIKAVSSGPGSFAEDPPNAVLSTFGGGGKPTEATVVLYAPRISGRSISFPVKLQEGEIPPTFKGASLFIDHWHHHPHVGAFVAGALIGHAVTRASEPKTVVVTQPNYYYQATPVPAQSPDAHLSLDDKLEKLKEMHEKGLITDDEYNAKRKQVLDEMN